jgi:hypothetical protein
MKRVGTNLKHLLTQLGEFESDVIAAVAERTVTARTFTRVYFAYTDGQTQQQGRSSLIIAGFSQRPGAPKGGVDTESAGARTMQLSSHNTSNVLIPAECRMRRIEPHLEAAKLNEVDCFLSVN